MLKWDPKKIMWSIQDHIGCLQSNMRWKTCKPNIKMQGCEGSGAKVKKGYLKGARVILSFSTFKTQSSALIFTKVSQHILMVY